MKFAIMWVFVALAWSSSFTAIKLGVDTIAPLPVAAGRMIIGASLLLVFLYLRGGRLQFTPRALLNYAVPGLIGNAIPFVLIGYGETQVASGLAAILMGTVPVMTVALAHFIIPDEKMRLRSTSGVMIGFVGIIWLVGPGALADLGSHLNGELAIFLATIGYAVSTVFLKQFGKRPPLETAAGAMLMGALVMSFATVITSSTPTLGQISASSFWAVCYLGVVPTALATVVYYMLVPLLGATRMAQVNFAIPLAGTALGVAFLGEAITMQTLVALVIILVSIYLVTAKPSKARLAAQISAANR